MDKLKTRNSVNESSKHARLLQRARVAENLVQTLHAEWTREKQR